MDKQNHSVLSSQNFCMCIGHSAGVGPWWSLGGNGVVSYRFLISILNFRRVQTLDLSFFWLGINSCKNMSNCGGGGGCCFSFWQTGILASKFLIAGITLAVSRAQGWVWGCAGRANEMCRNHGARQSFKSQMFCSTLAICCYSGVLSSQKTMKLHKKHFFPNTTMKQQ